MANQSVTGTSAILSKYRDIIASKMFEQIDRNGDCHIWLGPRWDNRHEYGVVRISKNLITYRFKTHRVMGALSLDLDIDDSRLAIAHKCNNKQCLNPEHLYICTIGQNTIDAYKDGLHNNRVGKYNSKCKSGHTRVINYSGRYYCPECQRRRDQIKARNDQRNKEC